MMQRTEMPFLLEINPNIVFDSKIGLEKFNPVNMINPNLHQANVNYTYT